MKADTLAGGAIFSKQLLGKNTGAWNRPRPPPPAGRPSFTKTPEMIANHGHRVLGNGQKNAEHRDLGSSGRTEAREQGQSPHGIPADHRSGAGGSAHRGDPRHARTDRAAVQPPAALPDRAAHGAADRRLPARRRRARPRTRPARLADPGRGGTGAGRRTGATRHRSAGGLGRTHARVPLARRGAARHPVFSPRRLRFPRAGASPRAGFCRGAAQRRGATPRDRAFRATAELLLFQHSCHWYCRSRWVADARLLAAHKTPHSQVLASVAPATRTDYLALVNGRNS